MTTNRYENKPFPRVRRESYYTPARTDRYSRKCKRFGCDLVIAALGPNAQATVMHNMRGHVAARHKDQLETEKALG